MRYQAALLAALGLALALPAGAAINLKTGAAAAPVALTAAVKTQAGILPTSPLSGIDKAFDSLSMAVALTPTAKTTAALKVAQENAAEAAVMSEVGNVALTTKALVKVDTALDIAVVAATKVTEPTAAINIKKQLVASTVATEATLQLGFDAAPIDVKPQILVAVNTTIDKLVAAPITVDAAVLKVAPKPVAKCDTALFTSCVRENGCTKDTSQKCFVACPPKTVPCQNAATGKTCTVPDTACVNDCLQKIVICSDTCMTQANCKKGEVSTSTLQIIAPDDVQRGFQLQLKAGGNVNIKK